jgi:hypothetical protein
MYAAELIARRRERRHQSNSLGGRSEPGERTIELLLSSLSLSRNSAPCIALFFEFEIAS